MPELPEVETIVRGLRGHLVGKTITRTELIGRPTFRQKTPQFLTSLVNVRVRDVVRYGKSILIGLEKEDSTLKTLEIHLGMTGQLLWESVGSPRMSHTHVIFHLNEPQHELRFRDIRRFGKLSIPSNGIKRTIPDAWENSTQDLFQALFGKDVHAKHALLQQKYIVGLGNIYVDESLFRSKIHPRKKLSRLSKPQLHQLCLEIKNVLKESIDLGGTSFSNYVDLQGGRGGYKGRLLVYGKKGKPCVNCRTLIKKIVLAGRGTHFCPRCQKP